MGMWSIVIEGQGTCGNGGAAFDADRMGAELVEVLRRNGQHEVKGFFVYGMAKLATQAEATMRRTWGCHDKMAIPLSPLCDHREHVRDSRGSYTMQCPAPATIAQTFGPEVVTVRCAKHDMDLLNPHYLKRTIPTWQEVIATIPGAT